jgi:hypothetical protein
MPGRVRGRCLNQITLARFRFFYPGSFTITSFTFPLPCSSSGQASAMANALGAVYRYAIPIAIGASLVQASIYDVKGGTRAVIFDRLSGVKENVVNEGTHFLIPWLQKSIIYDVRTKPRNISTTTGSKDLQMVSLTLRVLHRPEVKMLPKIYQVGSRNREGQPTRCGGLCPTHFISFGLPHVADSTHSPLVWTTTSVSSHPSGTKC